MSREYPCVYHDDGKCLLNSEPSYTDWCVFGPCSHETPSNADHIRSMTDEELAEWVYKGFDTMFCRNDPRCAEMLEEDGGIPAEKCRACALEWLKRPHEEEAWANMSAH